MGITMYDTVTPDDIPPNPDAIALYIDGAYKVDDAIWERWPDALRCEIAVRPSTNRGNMLDCEPGNCTPDQTPGWVRLRMQSGCAKPVIYCMASWYGQVRAYLEASGLPVFILVAEWNGKAHSVPGTVGCQWANPSRLPAELRGRNLDISTVDDTSWLMPPLHAVVAPVEPSQPTFPPFPGRLLVFPPDTTGHDVAVWQEQMHNRGWRITTDGDYGPRSRAVCEAFQAEKGLTVDGVVGPITWADSWTAPVTK